MNFELTSNGTFTTKLKAYDILDFQSLMHYVKKLPYGRNANRNDLFLVISEGKGTCSSKHAFLKAVANKNGLDEVKLILGMYKMTEQNTPKIGSALSENGIAFIPEAHCYLKFQDERIDVTSETSDFKKIENDILEEIEIQPNQVSEFKVDYHQEYLKKWIQNENSEHKFEELWKIRELCIQNISS